MRFSTLRIILWVVLYVGLAELGLELRANYRGFDTLLFGSYQQIKEETQERGRVRASEGTGEHATLDAATRNGTVSYWIASSSHAEDAYLSPQVIFPSVLERLMRVSGTDAKVINASHAGMDISDNTNDIRERGEKERPDYVILYQMSSTITALSKKLLSMPSTRRGPSSNGRKASAETSKTGTAWTVWLVEHSSIYAQLKGHVSSRLTEKRVLSDTLGSSGDAEFEARVRDFVSAAREIGATPVLCTFATSHRRRDLRNLPDSVVTLVFKYNIYLSLAGWFDAIDRFNHILRQIAASEGILLIDIESQIAGHPEYFRDFVHFTPLGHSRVAEVIYRGLSKQLAPSRTM